MATEVKEMIEVFFGNVVNSVHTAKKVKSSRSRARFDNLCPRV